MFFVVSAAALLGGCCIGLTVHVVRLCARVNAQDVELGALHEALHTALECGRDLADAANDLADLRAAALHDYAAFARQVRESGLEIDGVDDLLRFASSVDAACGTARAIRAATAAQRPSHDNEARP